MRLDERLGRDLHNKNTLKLTELCYVLAWWCFPSCLTFLGGGASLVALRSWVMVLP